MKLSLLLFVQLALIGSLVVPIAVAQSASDDELHLGALAYKDAKYEEAVRHFENAVSKDPGALKPHLYLATAYAQQYIPGAESQENVALAERAVEQYRKVLDIDPSTMDATKGIAYLYLEMKRFDKAKEYYRRATELDPKDPESYFSMGVVDWTQTYQPRMELRAKLGLKPEQPLILLPQCELMRDSNRDRVSEGIEMFAKAIELRPDYDDAMAYMNLMYRERADIQCGDTSANAADLETADRWVDKTMAVKKAKAAKAERDQKPTPPGSTKQ